MRSFIRPQRLCVLCWLATLVASVAFLSSLAFCAASEETVAEAHEDGHHGEPSEHATPVICCSSPVGAIPGRHPDYFRGFSGGSVSIMPLCSTTASVPQLDEGVGLYHQGRDPPLSPAPQIQFTPCGLRAPPEWFSPE